MKLGDTVKLSWKDGGLVLSDIQSTIEVDFDIQSTIEVELNISLRKFIGSI